MSIGQRIKHHREKNNLKQLDLANAMQVTPQSVSKWERDENYPDIASLLKLSGILGVSTDYLLGRTEVDQGVFPATVLSTSIMQYADKSLEVGAKEIADWTNGIFYHLTESVLRFDGIPIKYVGDGFLSFFSGIDHADRAIYAALAAKEVTQSKELIISIHSGEIYLGTIGHPDYASRDIIGSTVNNTFLMMDWIAKNCTSGIGASKNTIQQIKQSFKYEEKKSVRIPLTKEKQTIYEIKPIRRRK